VPAGDDDVHAGIIAASDVRTSVRVVERPLTPNEKGAIAEQRIVAEAIRLDIPVLRPVIAGCRYDVAFDFGDRIARVQCKWGRILNDCVVARISTCRHSPTRGYVRTTYSPAEIDAFAIYCGDLDRCFYVPITEVAARHDLNLRLTRPKNNQRIGVTLADDHLLGAVAQLGERDAGSVEVRGSSPLSSTS
jgi:PD-(D/E)XK endonuclease